MATIEFRTYRAQLSPGAVAGISIAFDFQEPPFPRRLVECKTTAEALAAYAQYETDVGNATDALVGVTMSLAAGRAPNGYKAAERAQGFYRAVNYPALTT